MKTITIDGKNLSIDEIYQVAYSGPKDCKVKLCSKSLSLMETSRSFVLDIVKKEKAVYGINTGFGALADKQVPKSDLKKLQYNLIRSHCTGVGKPFAKGVTRAIMLLRANCLASGHSGVNPEIVQLILDFLNNDIIPVVPSKGSVGASGDLAPLSHIALALIGEGDVVCADKTQSSKSALKEKGLKPAELGPKDGLALINGTAVMAALGSLAIHEAFQMAKISDINTALTMEGMRGTNSAFDPLISGLKPLPGQRDACYNLNILTETSEIKESHKDCGRVQDPYSLRCAPQVHGACRQTLLHAKEIFDIEINSVTDNPLIFPDEGKVLSGGNFHGEAVALAMDYLAMGLAELANICERRIEKMMNPSFSDLPHFLVKNSGLNSGLMIAHVTVAALVSENKVLCHPSSVDSIPTSTDKEDHVSMGVTSGRKLHEILRNLKNCLAIELLCNTQAIYLLRPLKTNKALEAVVSLIRKHVEPIDEDRTYHQDIAAILKLVSSGEIIEAVEKITGELK